MSKSRSRMSHQSYLTLTGSRPVSTTAPMFHLQTLGRLDLRTAKGSTVQGVQTRTKDLVLLTYLAAARPFGFHRRDTLLAMFWAELDLTHGRNALSQALHRIRASLKPGVVLTQGRAGVGLSRRQFSCDAIAFEKHLEDGEVARALRLYAGDFLAGVHVSGVAPEFDDWIVIERERLQRRAFNALLVLIEVEEKSGNDQGLDRPRPAACAQGGRHLRSRDDRAARGRDAAPGGGSPGAFDRRDRPPDGKCGARESSLHHRLHHVPQRRRHRRGAGAGARRLGTREVRRRHRDGPRPAGRRTGAGIRGYGNQKPRTG